MHPLFRPYAETILQVFLSIEQSLIGNASFRDIAGYSNFLQHYIAQQEVPFTGTPLRGVQVLGLLETRSLCFDNVYMLNVNDDVLPGGIESDVLLPRQLREKLGMETRRDRDKLSEYYFNLLVRGAKRVHLFFSETGDRDKSRFIEQLLWEQQKRRGSFTSDSIMQTVRYKINLANDSVQAIQKSEPMLEALRSFSYSASALDTYLQCPIRFLYRFVLRLEEKEHVSDDLDNQDIGILVHEVLKKFYEPFVGTKLELSKLNADRMEQVVEELFTQKFGAEPAGAAYLLKRQIQQQLTRMLINYQKSVVEKNDVVLKGLEEKISIRTFGVKFEGRLDRIEQRGTSVFILDYKTGPQPSKVSINFKKLKVEERDTWNDAVVSLQLPFYLLLYSEHTGIDIQKIIPAYLYLGDNRLSEESEVVFQGQPAERATCFEQMRSIIELLLHEINDAAIPFLPPNDLTKTCPRCPYTALCGTSWVRGWKD